MYGKLLLLILFGIGVSAGAQGGSMTGKVTRSVVKASGVATERTLLATRVRVPNLQLGREALRLHVSNVGVGDYAKKANRFSLASSLVPSTSFLDKLQAHHWVVKPLPGYICSVKELSSFSPAKQAELLNKVYGFDTKYRGVFASTFEDLRALAYRPVEGGVDALSALQSVRIQATEGKTGFLALAIEGNSYRPKDILVWDIAEKRWLSWNYSKSAVLRKEHEALRAEFMDQNAYWAWQLDTQGVVVRPDSYDEPTSIRISVDGVNWQEFKLDTLTGLSIWEAWIQKLYISYDRHTHKARFALHKDAPLFSSPESVFLWQDAADMGVRMTESAVGEPILILDGLLHPNLYSYGADGKVQSVPGVRLKVNEFFRMDPLSFMRELQKISREALQANPSAKLVFLEKKARSGEFTDVRECVEIL
ncbi:MAG: hypothetical protein PUK24_06215 [Elusimicrobia bacterium]|nr:hypothetical protein [Elusimicrobiota bacterium]MDY6039785.1 hypothetical protein [Elusimicrobiaceae bacterium]